MSYEENGPSSCPRIVASDGSDELELDVRRLSDGDVRLEFRVVDAHRDDRESAWVFVEREHVRDLLKRIADAVRDVGVSV